MTAEQVTFHCKYPNNCDCCSANRAAFDSLSAQLATALADLAHLTGAPGALLRCECSIHSCARCGIQGPACAMVIEEADEWECPECNERCNAEELSALPASPQDGRI